MMLACGWGGFAMADSPYPAPSPRPTRLPHPAAGGATFLNAPAPPAVASNATSPAWLRNDVPQTAAPASLAGRGPWNGQSWPAAPTAFTTVSRFPNGPGMIRGGHISHPGPIIHHDAYTPAIPPLPPGISGGRECVPEGEFICEPCVVQPHGFYGGFEFLWMRAHFDQNVAMIIDPVPGNTMVAFDYEYELMPRVWAGWQSTKQAGFRATYWEYDEEAATETATAVAGATPVYVFVYGAGDNLSRNAYADLGETLTTDHRLELYATDLELTQQFRLASLQMMAGAGVRIARMDQLMRGEVFDAAGVLQEVVTNDLEFEGAGPTISLDVTRPFGTSCVAFYSRLRGSLLMGETDQSIYEMKNAGADEVLDRAVQREVLSVGELGLGLQVSRSLGSRGQWYARTGYECQIWHGAGGPVDSDSAITLDGISLATGLRF